ncbi:MAG: hypothetical protein JWO81_106 [Alphaproteobacteria bacterium]|nr:hypothetical protein [Alphaproteobacteria bacterium]
MNVALKAIVAGFVSVSLVGTGVGPASAAPAHTPVKAVAATPPPPIQVTPAALPLAPPPAETDKQRKEREKAEAKARKLAQREADHAAKELDKKLHPERHEGRKKVLACAAGAAIGIAAALLFRGRKHNGVGDVILGGIAGCAAGWALGGALRGDDSQRLDAFVNHDVAMRDENTVRAWKAPNSGETILIQPMDAGYKPIQAVFTLAPGVDTPQPGVVILAHPMRATTALRLRSGPDGSANANVVGTFAPNEIVQMIAQTADRKWALIGVDNVVVGYASTAYLSSSLALPAEAPIHFAAMKPPATAPVRRARGKAPAATPALRLAVASAPPRSAVVLASTSCKTITASHGSNSSTQQRCARADMSWA